MSAQEERRRESHRRSVQRSMAARRAAESRLVALHAEEFDELYEQEKARLGIESMKVRQRARAERMAAEAAELLGQAVRPVSPVPDPVPPGQGAPVLPVEEAPESVPLPRTWGCVVGDHATCEDVSSCPCDCHSTVTAQAQDDPDPLARR